MGNSRIGSSDGWCALPYIVPVAVSECSNGVFGVVLLCDGQSHSPFHCKLRLLPRKVGQQEWGRIVFKDTRLARP